MSRILREPLLHFLVLGAALFIAFSLLPKPSGSDGAGRIVITQGQIDSMIAGYTRTWQRPPTTDELQALIRDRVREEVYYREALALGLDKDDLIIRRRLRQKMEFVTGGVVAQAQPTEDELNAYLNGHPDRFRIARQVSFSQVYLNPEKHGEHLARDAAQLFARLNTLGAKADVSAVGDSIMLDHQFAALPSTEVGRLFGDQFATELDKLEPGRWQGPIESAYGVHLVFVSKRTEGRLPLLAEVRDAVIREWTNARRLEVDEQYYQDLLRRYVVTVEPPPPAADKQKLAVAK